MFVGVQGMQRTPVGAILVGLWLAGLSFRAPRGATAASAARAGAGGPSSSSGVGVGVSANIDLKLLKRTSTAAELQYR